MRKLLLMMLGILLGVQLHAQVIRESLEGVGCRFYQGGVLVTGFDRTGEKGMFIATLYDGELNVLKKYTKEIDDEFSVGGGYTVVFSDHVELLIATKPKPHFLKLSAQLEEISYVEITDDVKKAEKAARSDDDKMLPPGGPFPSFDLTGRAGRAGLQNYWYIGDNMVVFNEKTQSLSRYSYLPNKLNTICHKLWECPITGYDKVKSHGNVYADNDQVICSLVGKGDNGWEDFLTCIDAKTGTIQKQFPLRFGAEGEKFYFSNAYYDKEKEQIVVVGELVNVKGKDVPLSGAVLVYDKSGKLIFSKTIAFREYSLDVKRDEFDLNDKSILGHNIGKLANGNYFVVYENSCMGIFVSRVTGGSANGSQSVEKKYVPVGYSYFEITPQNEIVNTKTQFLNDFDKTRTVRTKSQGAERYVLLEKTKKDSKTPMYIDFGSDQPVQLTELEEMDFKSDINYNFNPAYDADFFKQIPVDVNHAVTFQKMRGSNIYELKSILIK